jgi:hypothetical protein
MRFSLRGVLLPTGIVPRSAKESMNRFITGPSLWTIIMQIVYFYGIFSIATLLQEDEPVHMTACHHPLADRKP